MPLIGLISLVTDGLKPDFRPLYFDIEVEEGLARITANSDREVNRLDMESLGPTPKKSVRVSISFGKGEAKPHCGKNRC